MNEQGKVINDEEKFVGDTPGKPGLSSNVQTREGSFQNAQEITLSSIPYV
jgi:hypothetical protein